MDKETLDRIDQMENKILKTVNTRIDDVKEHTRDMVVMSGKLNRTKMMAEMEDMREDIILQLAPLKDCPTKVQELGSETIQVRWLFRKPGRAAGILATTLIAIIMLSSFLATRIDPRETVENVIEDVTPIEFKEDEAQGPDTSPR